MTTHSDSGMWRYATDLGRGLIARGARVAIAGFGPRPNPRQLIMAERAGMELFWLHDGLDWLACDESDLRVAAKAVDDLLRRWQPTVLHLNTPALGAFMAGSAPCVASVHVCLDSWWRATRFEGPPHTLEWQNRATAAGLGGADIVVAASSGMASRLRQAYGPLPHLRTITNGSDGIAAAEKEPFAFAAGCWGNEAENLTMLADAAGECKWPVYFAGPISRAIRDRKARTVRWAGDLSQPEIEDWLSRAAVFVSPVLYEPFGVTVRDAASAGAALVLSDIQVHREQWDRCALLVDPLNPASIAEAINRFALDEATRSRLARAARVRAAEASLSAQVESFLIAYGDAEAARAAAV